MIPTVPAYISDIMSLMHKNDFSPYLVGGCVRDFLMGKTPHDFDITVCVCPDAIIRLFEDNNYRTIPKGRKFGTIGVLCGKEVVEITPYRIEGSYTDSRHPDTVEFVKDISLDLSRRDFTINAMAMDKDGKILDLFGGKEDLTGKTVRCVGKADKRFGEDALRILRAIRFASRLGFTIEEKTRLAMSNKKHLLHNISAERIHSELEGTLIHPRSYEILTDCSDVIAEIIPGFVPHEFLKSDYGDFSARLFSCILTNNFSDICKICDFLKLSNAEADKIKSMHTLYTQMLTLDKGKIIFDEKTKTALCTLCSEYIKDLFLITNSDTKELLDFLDNGIYTVKKLAVSGGDIANSEIFPKSETSNVLQNVLYAVALGRINNTREEIFNYLDFLLNNKSE